MIAKVAFEPADTACAPEGAIEPSAPAEAAMVKISPVKTAEIVWLAVTLVNWNDVSAPTETPSTSTSATW